MQNDKAVTNNLSSREASPKTAVHRVGLSLRPKFRREKTCNTPYIKYTSNWSPRDSLTTRLKQLTTVGLLRRLRESRRLVNVNNRELLGSRSDSVSSVAQWLQS